MQIRPQFLTSSKQDEPFDVQVHSSMTIGELRREIQYRLGRHGQKLEFFYQGTDFIDQTEDKKTFEEIGIGERSSITIKMAENTGTSSPDTSGESSPTGSVAFNFLCSDATDAIWVRCKNVAWGSAPDPRWGSAPDPLGAPPQIPRLGGGSGAEPPAAFLRRSRPGVWGGAPTAAAPLPPPLWLCH